MKTKFLIVIIAMIEVFFSPCYGKDGQNFYIDSRNGNDRADGQNPKTAW